MSPSIENILGNHEAHLNSHDKEIAEVREQQREDRADVRGLRNWLMGILATALGGLALQLVNILAAAAKK